MRFAITRAVRGLAGSAIQRARTLRRPELFPSEGAEAGAGDSLATSTAGKPGSTGLPGDRGLPRIRIVVSAGVTPASDTQRAWGFTRSREAFSRRSVW